MCIRSSVVIWGICMERQEKNTKALNYDRAGHFIASYQARLLVRSTVYAQWPITSWIPFWEEFHVIRAVTSFRRNLLRVYTYLYRLCRIVPSSRCVLVQELQKRVPTRQAAVRQPSWLTVFLNVSRPRIRHPLCRTWLLPNFTYLRKTLRYFTYHLPPP
jgi:hypothetical protein